MKMSGFSLIEIMISSFILALGLLGLAGMQSTAVKSTVEIQQRTLANALVADINERMQLNRAWLQEAGHDYAITSLMNAQLSKPSCVGDAGVFDNCSGEDIKNNDLYEWKNKFIGAYTVSNSGGNSGLIEADACIDAADSGANTIILSWLSTVKSKDAAADSDPASMAYKCGQANAARRQLIVQVYTGKSS
ncbi:MAG: type IV pilus modification protein PilV [Psychromonas sp.]|nr:type IV pilus modification protein PilV [Psychromonas sp.]